METENLNHHRHCHPCLHGCYAMPPSLSLSLSLSIFGFSLSSAAVPVPWRHHPADATAHLHAPHAPLPAVSIFMDGKWPTYAASTHPAISRIVRNAHKLAIHSMRPIPRSPCGHHYACASLLSLTAGVPHGKCFYARSRPLALSTAVPSPGPQPVTALDLSHH